MDHLRFGQFAFGWDPSDGEIVAYADIWVMDGTVAQQQFHRMLQNYLPTIDTNSVRIRTTMETGKDPGEEDPAKLVEKMLGDKGQLPEEIRKLVEKLSGKKPPEPEKKGPEFDQI